MNQHPWKLTKFKDTTKEKEKVKVKGRQKESQIGQHGDLVQEVPLEEEEKVKVEKEKARAKERKAKVKQKERKEAREVKVAKGMIGADSVAKQATGEMNAPIEW